MASAPVPRNQHYVPKFLLKNFADDGTKTLFVFDKQKGIHFPKAPKKVAAEDYFYEFPGEPTGDVEAELSRVESKTAPVIKKLIATKAVSALTTSERQILAEFVALQIVRVPYSRSIFEQVGNILNKKFGMPLPTPEELKARNIENLSSSADLTKVILEKHWMVYENYSGIKFYLSDNPVVCFNINPSNGRGRGFGSEGAFIYCPISSNYCLGFICAKTAAWVINRAARAEFGIRHRPIHSIPVAISEGFSQLASFASALTRRFQRVPKEDQTHINFLQVGNSSRYIFSSDENFEFVRQSLKEEPKLISPPMLSYL